MEPNIEKSFFDILSHLTGAFTQTGYIIGGTICLLLGGVILADWLRWKVKADEVEATITGLRQRGIIYYPVYRYMLDGVEQEATSNSGSSSTRGQETGKQVMIQVMRHDPGRAQPARAIIWPLVGLLLAAPGLWLVYTAFTAFEVNGFTWATLAVLAIMSFNRFRRSIIPKNQRLSVEEWRMQRRSEIDLLPVQTAEDLRQSPSAQAEQARYAKQAKITAPLMLLLGAAAIGGALYLGSGTLDMMGAEKAQGEVIQLASNGEGNYQAVVKFTADGRDITFRDSIASHPPLYDEGEKVDVLYKKDNAEGSAVIDRGILNWLLPGGLGIIGLLLLLGGLKQMPRQRDEVL